MFTERRSVGLDVPARSVAAAAIDGVTGELFQTKLTPTHTPRARYPWCHQSRRSSGRRVAGSWSWSTSGVKFGEHRAQCDLAFRLWSPRSNAVCLRRCVSVLPTCSPKRPESCRKSSAGASEIAFTLSLTAAWPAAGNAAIRRASLRVDVLPTGDPSTPQLFQSEMTGEGSRVPRDSAKRVSAPTPRTGCS